ncbi:MAG: ATP-binding cassette domain-containing protein [Candidatus Aegiribacteria sp.]|nr:ATP-binding cassette domain-containing protein [Candidatus Aegiribacteria sp.]
MDGISLCVSRGEIFGIVGPNGAGKTTTMDCIVSMRSPDSGFISVLGLDPLRQRKALLEKVGIQQQESELPDRMKVCEAIELFSCFYGISMNAAGILSRLGLSDKKESYFSALSGGQKKRLFVALSLVGDPEIVFLDELTSGLDPRSRRSMWDLVRGLRDDGKTVFLSTHYMDEAEKLCDRVAIIDNGKIVAMDTPESLIRSHAFTLSVVMGIPESFNEREMESITGVVEVFREDEKTVVRVRDSSAVVGIVKLLVEREIELGNFHTEKSTLEDVFLKLTGKEIND